ncbi:hypothetical protein [Aquimarina spongiae]|uniref:Chain length determinant protein n=1 Tax=Aquimarina spongiae TaxID=570521 RepID=A0A1M6FB24_9FLAO|nr:hypothetical protein [Aquimarina spongiae]SHI94809.1 hypothetical protein SAMN04488508_104181 [Aquimarina spongiae]
MSQANQNEEMDLMQLFAMIKEFFRKVLSLFVDAVLFIKKKIILFLILGVLGGGLGYFMDQFQDKKNSFVQEVIIEPKYKSVEYLYDFVEDLQDNFKDDNYVLKFGLDLELVKNVDKITLQPVIRSEEILTQIQDKESFTEDYDDNLLRERKYRNFYKEHKLTLIFKNSNPENTKIVAAILKHLKSNEYFKKIVSLELQQLKGEVEQNRKTLAFINDYLDNLSKNPNENEGKIVFASETETPTIASLIKRKEELLTTVRFQERSLELNKEIYSVVKDTGIISKQKQLSKRMLFVIPLIFVGIAIGIYFFSFLFKSVVNFVNQE